MSFLFQALTMWIQNNPEYAALNIRENPGYSLKIWKIIILILLKNLTKYFCKIFLCPICEFFFREKVEKLNFSSSFMSKDLHSQEGAESKIWSNLCHKNICCVFCWYVLLVNFNKISSYVNKIMLTIDLAPIL